LRRLLRCLGAVDCAACHYAAEHDLKLNHSCNSASKQLSLYELRPVAGTHFDKAASDYETGALPGSSAPLRPYRRSRAAATPCSMTVVAPGCSLSGASRMRSAGLSIIIDAKWPNSALPPLMRS